MHAYAIADLTTAMRDGFGDMRMIAEHTDPPDPHDLRQPLVGGVIKSRLTTGPIFGAVYQRRPQEVPIQTYHRRGRNPVDDPPLPRRSPEDGHRTYHRWPTEPPVVTYQRRGGGALEQYEELMNEDFDDEDDQQFRTYHRRE